MILSRVKTYSILPLLFCLLSIKSNLINQAIKFLKLSKMIVYFRWLVNLLRCILHLNRLAGKTEAIILLMTFLQEVRDRDEVRVPAIRSLYTQFNRRWSRVRNILSVSTYAVGYRHLTFAVATKKATFRAV